MSGRILPFVRVNGPNRAERACGIQDILAPQSQKTCVQASMYCRASVETGLLSGVVYPKSDGCTRVNETVD